MKKSADVVVLGAGVVGLFTAYYLAMTGRSVVVLESGHLGAGASGVNLGQLSVMDRETDMQLAWTLKSLDLYRELKESEDIESELFQSGGLLLFGSEEQKNNGLDLMKRQMDRKVPVAFVPPGDLAAIEPFLSNPDVVGGLHCPWEGTVMPLTILAGLADAAVRRGVEIAYRTPVVGFRTRNDRIDTVVTNRMEFSTDWVVAAAGSWTRELGILLGLDLPVYYHKGTALVTIQVPRCVRSVIVSGGFLVNRPASGRVVGLGVAQHLNGSILIGQATEYSVGYSRSLSVEGVYETAENFLKYFPALGRLEIIRAWAGNTTYTPDGSPVYGFSDNLRNVFITAGLKGAFSTAPAAGKMAADLISARDGSVGENADVMRRWNIDGSELASMSPDRRMY